MIVTVLPLAAEPEGLVPRTVPARALEYWRRTAVEKPACSMLARASSRLWRATEGTSACSLAPFGLGASPAAPNGVLGLPSSARSMIAFQVGAAMLAPKTTG